MNEILCRALAFAGGAGLGVIFFGGLWWTIQKAVVSKTPALWFMGSLLLRMSVTLGGFYLISQGRWQRMLMCLAGLFIARLAVTWATRRRKGDQLCILVPIK
jgi:F1F0 ATPase subunit 2